EDALGILALTPSLLVAFTPWLIRNGLANPGPKDRPQHPETGKRWTWAEAIEITSLALVTGVVGLLLAAAFSRGEPASFHLWGVPLLLVVWASLRQGLRGGVLVASSATLLAMFLVDALLGRPEPLSPLQGNLLAQCSTALLVGASASWIRTSEARYRQVIRQIPVVLYSARLLQRLRPGAAPQVEITLVSPASQQILGCAPEDLLGDYDRWLQRIHPTDREVLLAAVAQLCLQNQPVTCEYR